jgi:hypothetical protein
MIDPNTPPPMPIRETNPEFVAWIYAGGDLDHWSTPYVPTRRTAKSCESTR